MDFNVLLEKELWVLDWVQAYSNIGFIGVHFPQCFSLPVASLTSSMPFGEGVFLTPHTL